MAYSDSIFFVLKRVYRLLNEKERKRSVLLLLSIFVNSIIEILGLAFIVPVIGLVVQPEQIKTNAYLKRAFELTSTVGIDTPNRFLILLCALMIGAFLFKALFGLAVNLFQTRFSFAVAHRLSGQMWSYHFSKSLQQLRKNDTGRIMAEVSDWPLDFARIFMSGGLLILSEFGLVLSISVILLTYSPIASTGVSLVFLIGSLLLRFVLKRKLTAYSAIIEKTKPAAHSIIVNATRGFIDIITNNASKAIKEDYLKARKAIFRITANVAVLNQAPARIYEFIAVSVLAVLIIYSILSNNQTSEYFQLLSMMLIGAYRIMPAMSRINGALMQMRSGIHVLTLMEAGAEVVEPSSIELVTNCGIKKPITINIASLTVTYSNLDTPVFQDLNYLMTPNKVHGIIGPSGCGKSSLLNVLLGLHHPSRGKVQIQEPQEEPRQLYDDYDLYSWIKSLSYVGQHPFLFKGSVIQNLTLGDLKHSFSQEMVVSLIHKLDLASCLGENPLDFEIEEGGSNLSGGQQQRLALLRALQIQRPVIILDEATSALDNKLRDVVFEILKERAAAGCNVILVTHDMDLAERCDDVLDLGKQIEVQLS